MHELDIKVLNITDARCNLEVCSEVCFSFNMTAGNIFVKQINISFFCEISAGNY